MKRKNSAKILQTISAGNSLHEKKWAAIAKDYVALWADGWNEELILDIISKKYFVEPVTVRARLRLRDLRREGSEAMRAKIRASRNGTYIETQTAPMNGVEYR